MHHKKIKLTVFWRKYFPTFPENTGKNVSFFLWCCHRIWWLFVSLVWICYRHPLSTTTHTPTSHPHILAPCGRNRAHRELLRATACFPSPFQFTALLSSSWEKFQVWTHFKSPVVCGKHFHSHSCAPPPALGCLLPPLAEQQLRWSQGSCFSSQPGGKKQKACPASLPLGGSMLLDWQEPPILPLPLETKEMMWTRSSNLWRASLGQCVVTRQKVSHSCPGIETEFAELCNERQEVGRDLI